ncbi:MAG: hypothetical protein ABGX16_17640 [Pirellulales bacterium]
MAPAVSIRQGDWKLIRRFETDPKHPEVLELHNLKKDIGESRNLASLMSDKVRELDALIEQFVQETGALYPKPNPNYQPNSNEEIDTQTTPSSSDLTAGLVPRYSKLVKTDGANRVVGEGRQPFLGTSQVKFKGPLTLKLRARSKAGGRGRVHWKARGQEAFPKSEQSVAYHLPKGKSWQDITVALPIDSKTGIIRLYLPAGSTAVEIQSNQFLDQRGREKSWDFRGEAP